MRNQENAAVRVLLPLAEESGDLPTDQTEQVTINGKMTTIHRGEYVEVKPQVFVQLRSRYPNL